MNLRLLFAVTLLSLISFHLSAMTTTGQQSASANDGHKGLELDISCSSYRRELGMPRHNTNSAGCDWQRSCQGLREGAELVQQRGETGICGRRICAGIHV